MARLDTTSAEMALMGGRPMTADMFFELGLMHSSGREGDPDYISAHKWFNLAAMNGNEEAAYYRKQVASEMSKSDMALALKAAREWLKIGA